MCKYRKGKKYIYGYVANKPYDISNSKGINLEFLKGFEKFSGVEFQYKKYNSIKALKKAFESGEIDLVFNYYNMDTSSSNQTINVYNSSYVLLAHNNNNITIDSWMSLSGKEIYAIKDIALTTYINNNSKATIKAYSKIESLLKSGFPIVRSSRIGNGLINFPINKIHTKGISSNNLNPQKSRILLTLGLTRTKDLNELQDLFNMY